jgi:hypothetical protein
MRRAAFTYRYSIPFLAALLFAAVGCGGPNSAQVRGTVTLDNHSPAAQ